MSNLSPMNTSAEPHTHSSISLCQGLIVLRERISPVVSGFPLNTSSVIKVYVITGIELSGNESSAFTTVPTYTFWELSQLRLSNSAAVRLAVIQLLQADAKGESIVKIKTMNTFDLSIFI